MPNKTETSFDEPEPICGTCGKTIDKNEGYTMQGGTKDSPGRWWCREHEPQEERAIL